MPDYDLDTSGDGPTVNHQLPPEAGLEDRLDTALDGVINAVLSVEGPDGPDGPGVWVSGMNAACRNVARRVASHLQAEGFIVDLTRDDGVHAADNGGLFVPVKGYTTGDCPTCGRRLFMVYNENGNGTQCHVPTPDGADGPPMLSKHV